MGKETERKFLVKNNSWEEGTVPELIKQGYLLISEKKIIRIRTFRNKGFLTIKAAINDLSKYEFEYEIPFAEAEEILNTLCKKPLIEKERTTITFENFVWEVDKFTGANSGLVIAEVEIENEDQFPPLPDWVGREVTGDHKYYNSNLVRVNYRKFKT